MDESSSAHGDSDGSAGEPLASPDDATAANALALERLRLETLDRVNRILVSATEVEEALPELLDLILEVLDCDRAWLLRPCDPEAEAVEMFYARVRPGAPPPPASREVLTLTDWDRQLLSDVLESRGAVVRPTDPERDTEDPALARLHVLATLGVAVHPQQGPPWCLGIHYCAKPGPGARDPFLLEAIGRRLSEGLSNLLVQRQLRESEARFRVLVDNAPEAITLLDADTGRYVDVNENAERLFGLSRDELLKIGPVATSPERQPDGRSSAEAAPELIAAAVSGGVPVFEWTHINADGDEVPCEIRLVLLPDPDRRLVRGSVTDISARKRAEAERARLAEQLVQAQKMEAVGQLTGGIAHDFNNILTVIVGNLELVLREDEVGEEARQLVSQSHAAASRAASLTARLLAFSRRQTLRPESLSLGRLLDDMGELLRRTLGEAVRVEFDVSPDLWPCNADPSQLESAVLNLAINARDAMGGAGRLKIAATNDSLKKATSMCDMVLEAGDYVRLAVEDDGPGMSETVRRQAFEPFFTTKEVGDGSGLGLSMVYGFARQSGGAARIAERSEGYGGTRVEVFLPRGGASTAQVGAPPARRSTLPADCLSGAGERVLVVEDAEDLRELAARLLKRLDYVPIAVRTGEEALAALAEQGPFDLLFTDIVLPGGLNGLSLVERARELVPGLPVLLTSGYAQGESLPPELEERSLVFLPKPYSLVDASRSLRRALTPGRG